MYKSPDVSVESIRVKVKVWVIVRVRFSVRSKIKIMCCGTG